MGLTGPERSAPALSFRQQSCWGPVRHCVQTRHAHAPGLLRTTGREGGPGDHARFAPRLRGNRHIDWELPPTVRESRQAVRLRAPGSGQYERTSRGALPTVRSASPAHAPVMSRPSRTVAESRVRMVNDRTGSLSETVPADTSSVSGIREAGGTRENRVAPARRDQCKAPAAVSCPAAPSRRTESGLATAETGTHDDFGMAFASGWRAASSPGGS